jgi:hypothetical protein
MTRSPAPPTTPVIELALSRDRPGLRSPWESGLGGRTLRLHRRRGSRRLEARILVQFFGGSVPQIGNHRTVVRDFEATKGQGRTWRPGPEGYSVRENTQG